MKKINLNLAPKTELGKKIHAMRLLLLMKTKGVPVKDIVGDCAYSQVLTYNILIKYYDEFKIKPFTSYSKYFQYPRNFLPLIETVKLKPLDELIRKRDYEVSDMKKFGITPKDLNMLTYSSIVPLSSTDPWQLY